MDVGQDMEPWSSSLQAPSTPGQCFTPLLTWRGEGVRAARRVEPGPTLVLEARSHLLRGRPPLQPFNYGP